MYGPTFFPFRNKNKIVKLQGNKETPNTQKGHFMTSDSRRFPKKTVTDHKMTVIDIATSVKTIPVLLTHHGKDSAIERNCSFSLFHTKDKERAVILVLYTTKGPNKSRKTYRCI